MLTTIAPAATATSSVGQSSWQLNAAQAAHKRAISPTMMARNGDFSMCTIAINFALQSFHSDDELYAFETNKSAFSHQSALVLNYLSDLFGAGQHAAEQQAIVQASEHTMYREERGC